LRLLPCVARHWIEDRRQACERPQEYRVAVGVLAAREGQHGHTRTIDSLENRDFTCHADVSSPTRLGSTESSAGVLAALGSAIAALARLGSSCPRPTACVDSHPSTFAVALVRAHCQHGGHIPVVVGCVGSVDASTAACGIVSAIAIKIASSSNCTCCSLVDRHRMRGQPHSSRIANVGWRCSRRYRRGRCGRATAAARSNG
jgi:hypothetical protein